MTSKSLELVLFSWNERLMRSREYEWDGYEDCSAYVTKVNTRGVNDEWNIGRRREVPPDAKALLVKTGPDNGGVVLSGCTKDGQATERKDGRRYVKIRWTLGVDWKSYPALSLREVLGTRKARHIGFCLQQSGHRLHGADAERLWSEWESHARYYSGRGLPKGRPQGLTPPDVSYDEGREQLRLGKTRSRASVWRRQLVNASSRCAACNCSYPSSFGLEGLRIFEVHHLEALRHGRRGTRREDLVVLCRNCHALAHTSDPPLLPSAIQGLLNPKSMR